jgi:hypothetical protein
VYLIRFRDESHSERGPNFVHISGKSVTETLAMIRHRYLNISVTEVVLCRKTNYLLEILTYLNIGAAHKGNGCYCILPVYEFCVL